jgi:hypothetical protein
MSLIIGWSGVTMLVLAWLLFLFGKFGRNSRSYHYLILAGGVLLSIRAMLESRILLLTLALILVGIAAINLHAPSRKHDSTV